MVFRLSVDIVEEHIFLTHANGESPVSVLLPEVVE